MVITVFVSIVLLVTGETEVIFASSLTVYMSVLVPSRHVTCKLRPPTTKGPLTVTLLPVCLVVPVEAFTELGTPSNCRVISASVTIVLLTAGVADTNTTGCRTVYSISWVPSAHVISKFRVPWAKGPVIVTVLPSTSAVPVLTFRASGTPSNVKVRVSSASIVLSALGFTETKWTGARTV